MVLSPNIQAHLFVLNPKKAFLPMTAFLQKNICGNINDTYAFFSCPCSRFKIQFTVKVHEKIALSFFGLADIIVP